MSALLDRPRPWYADASRIPLQPPRKTKKIMGFKMDENDVDSVLALYRNENWADTTNDFIISFMRGGNISYNHDRWVVWILCFLGFIHIQCLDFFRQGTLIQNWELELIAEQIQKTPPTTIPMTFFTDMFTTFTPEISGALECNERFTAFRRTIFNKIDPTIRGIMETADNPLESMPMIYIVATQATWVPMCNNMNISTDRSIRCEMALENNAYRQKAWPSDTAFYHSLLMFADAVFRTINFKQRNSLFK